MLSKVDVPHFEPRSGVRIAETDAQLQANGNSGNVDHNQLEELQQELPASSTFADLRVSYYIC
jgi:hypothetical protein